MDKATPDILTALRRSPLFEGWEPAALERLSQRMSLAHHEADKLLIMEAEGGGTVYFIIEGWVKIRTHNRDGREITLNILGPGEIFGEMAALAASTRSCDVLSVTPVLVGSLSSRDFMHVVQTEPLMGLRLSQLMARRLRQLNRRLRVRESDSVARVADVLLFLAEGQGRTSAQGIEIPNLPHRELGSLSGLTRETVTRVLRKLEQEGVIERISGKQAQRADETTGRGLIRVPNLAVLESLLN
ncbi:MAG: Crp/Fnr family transcriptional regulator [Gloeomargarita sp. SKYBB_i_bin120]|nr:Crp/Fnr family transcriptional regulator [Gloeomargarita sp. SKYG98]MCS7291748.1 Crp/Fnr family transcriptional regulator [Gloeomargarita sp. SKYB120]MDW8177308.1 Crp/Fnr family transcriptional regulator [Gloeomargarita sp. SKYBB_i_bin120]